jgi:regulator of cell morphogenesis and NO signaling
MSIDPARTVADLVLERPARARVFEQLGLDYCCGGKRTLASACAARGVDPDAAIAALAAVSDADAPESADWSSAPIGDLCDHIVDIHHARLREELPRLTGLLEKVVRAHGAERPELADVRSTFEGLRSELEEHMADEETRLFPACRDAGPLGPEDLAMLEDEHAEAGAALERLRALTGGFDLDSALCNTHRATLDGLHALELDLHQHIHEENNVLFPRVLERSAV